MKFVDSGFSVIKCQGQCSPFSKGIDLKKRGLVNKLETAKKIQLDKEQVWLNLKKHKCVSMEIASRQL